MLLLLRAEIHSEYLTAYWDRGAIFFIWIIINQGTLRFRNLGGVVKW